MGDALHRSMYRVQKPKHGPEAASRIAQLEAKLATAAGALERITKVQFAASARAIARNTLASIKGES